MDAPAWARELAAAGAGIVFLDELTTCAPSVQAAMLAVALDKTVGDLQLPADVWVVCGANPPDQAANGYELAAPLANRLCHVAFAPSVTDWLDGTLSGWASLPPSRAVAADPSRQVAVTAMVTGYLRHQPHHLDVYPVGEAAGRAWPSRRTWTMLMGALAHVRADDHAAVQALTFGLVGEGAGVEFLSWAAHADLPDPEAVIADPSIVDWTGRPDRVWAVLSGVVGFAASRGTVEAWRSAWGPLVAAAQAGAPDVAAAAARVLGRSRPAKATIPTSVRSFTPMLQAAGLLEVAA